ncbi:MAG TPA: hypothetical protein PLD20_05795 [Blastocatellia bacterium]|nr:hypothetical protein [Blastocatellia bacterium]HMV87613.1 hypothetical protein [Blastocatellia bacterium]HMX24719.1 hypothetical protein [Blastocatellia bacterium]HMY74915.1 hypothetical protein [Blastocatellia bacterium]HMZ17420.1 hypothetical protein [Blastocatellia bacterium]
MPTTKKTTKKSKKNPGVRRNGKVLYGAAAKAVLKQRAAKKRRASAAAKKTNPKRAGKKAASKRNSASYSSATPISVTHHYRSGGPGYATARERIIKQGQRDLFAPDASMDQLLGFLRKNPTVIDAVRKKLGAERFKTASPSLLKKTMREVIDGARGKGKQRNPRYLVTGINSAGKETELGFLVSPNKMQAVKKAKSIYEQAGYNKFAATLSDKQDYFGGEKRAPIPKKKPKRRNPDGELFEMFTGQPHTGHVGVIAPTGAPRNLDELGDFVEFKWIDAAGNRHTVNLEDQGIAAKLAGHQYADGRFEMVLTSAPGQKLPYFGDYLPAGDHGYIYEVTYRAQKAHLGDTKPRLYYHKLGEETGNPPIFHINRDGELIFKGGEYWIEASGIHN